MDSRTGWVATTGCARTGCAQMVKRSTIKFVAPPAQAGGAFFSRGCSGLLSNRAQIIPKIIPGLIGCTLINQVEHERTPELGRELRDRGASSDGREDVFVGRRDIGDQDRELGRSARQVGALLR